jgi:branched-chain amino acid transport system substrate-binding protein
MKRCPLFVSLLLCCAWPLFIGCAKEQKVVVAVMTKLEAGSIVGSSEVNAAKMFLEDHGVGNIEIIPFDDAWNPEKTKEAYREVRKRGIRFLITSHVSTCALAIAEEINKDGILTFVTGATTDLLSRKDDYILRNIQDVDEEQKSIAEYINRMPQKRLLIVRDTDNYGYTSPALQYLQNRLSKDRVVIVDVSMAKLDLTALEKRLKREDYDLLYLLIGGYQSTAGSIAQLAKKLSPNTKIIYTPWMKTPTLLETAGNSIKDSIIPSHYPPSAESPSIRDYMERYKKRFNYAPTFISLNVYTALQVLTEAIQAGNRTPDKVKAYIIGKGAFKTDFGTITFDPYGDTRMNLYFITDIPGEF